MGKVVTGLNKPNETAYFYPADGKWEIQHLPCKISTAMTEGAALNIEISGNTTTGYITLAGTENAAGADFVGILAEPIAATDDDYATAFKTKQVWVPVARNALAYFAVGAGTFTAVDVFKTVEITSGALGLSADTAGKGARIMGYMSATKGVCTFDLPNTETA